MKKIIITVTFFIGLVASAFAGEENVDPEVRNEFYKKFRHAEEVSWKVADSYYKASFVISGNWLDAYYSKNGRLLCVSRNIISFQLPLVLLNELKEKYPGYWISELFEVSTESGFTYYATMEKPGRKIVLQSSADRWKVFKTYKDSTK